MQSSGLPPAPRSRQIAEAQAAAAAGLPSQLPPPRPAPSTPTGSLSLQYPGSGGGSASSTAFPSAPTAVVASSGFGAPHAPSAASTVDYHKYKTKLCRNYVLGTPCPFDDRCVFAHGEEQLAINASPSGGMQSSMRGVSSYGSMGSMDFAAIQQQQYAAAASSPPLYSSDATPVNHYFPDGSIEEDFAAAAVGGGSGVHAAPFSPPSYETFISAAQPGSGSGSDSPVPVPTRYRHDPYSFRTRYIM